MKPAQHDIDTVLDWASEAEENGSHFQSMTYEQGVRDAIDFMNCDMSAHQLTTGEE